MLMKTDWAARFVRVCEDVRSARRRSFTAGQTISGKPSGGFCWIVVSGYVMLLDPRTSGHRFIRLILGRGGLFGDRPFGTEAFLGFVSPQSERGVAHGPAEAVEVKRANLEAAARERSELIAMLLEFPVLSSG
jgi:CRP-like cAMP-binding protein